MALPVITNNSPAAGSIAWTATNVSWADSDWPIAAGNTDKKFVWWEYRNGVPAVVAGDALPTFAPGDMILFINKNGVGALVPTMEIQDGSLLVPGSILASAIAADQIQTHHIDAGAVTATEIAAGAISADHIQAGAIMADKLSVGTVGDNAVVNGSFEDFRDNLIVGWEASAMTNGTIAPVTGVASSGKYSIQFAAANTSANLRLRQTAASFIPVSSASGRKYYVSARMGAGTATTSGSYLRVNWYDANKTYISASDLRSNGAMTTTFTIYEGQATPPSTARYMGIEILWTNINVTSTLYLDEVTVHEVTMAAQIGDGQVTAAKITAGTITSDRISASGITADKLLIADLNNYFVNPGFNQGSTFLDNWNAGAGTAIANTAFRTGRGLEHTATVSYASRYQTKTYLAEEGDKFYVSCTTYCTTGGFAPTVRMIFRDAAGTMIAGAGNQGTAATDTAGAYVERSNVLTAPAGTASCTLWVEMHNPTGATQRIGDLICRRMNGGELVVDGAITASKIATDAVEASHIKANAVDADAIAAGAVTAGKILAGEIGTNHMTANTINGDRILANSLAADKILANSITAGQMAANTITANEIAAGAITADEIAAGAIVADKIAATAIDGKTITGATVQTATTGARVVMDSAGLRAFDAAGTEYLTADDDGLTMVGTVIADGMTEGATPQPIQAIMGNWPEGPTGNAPPGLHFKRMDRTGADFFPRIYSYGGDTLALCSGGDPDIPGSTDESYLFLFPEMASLDGGREVQVRTDSTLGPGNGYLKIFNGSDDGLTPPDMKLYQTVGNIDIQAWEGNVDVEADNINLTANTYGEINLNPSQYGTGVHVNGDLNVTGTLNGQPIVGAWQPMTLAGTWANYTGGGGYIGGLRARRIGPNVQIQGMVKSGSGTISTLPSDLWPQFSAIRPVIAAGAAASIGISNAGTISYLSGTAAPSYVAINEILPL